MIDVRVHWVDDGEQCYSGPIRNPQALDCRLRAHRERGICMEVLDAPEQIAIADQVLRLSQHHGELEFGPAASPMLYRVCFCRLDEYTDCELAADAPVFPVIGGFPLLDQAPPANLTEAEERLDWADNQVHLTSHADELADAAHWREQSRRTAREIASHRGTEAQSVGLFSAPLRLCVRFIAAVGRWLRGQPRLRVVSPEAAAARRSA